MNATIGSHSARAGMAFAGAFAVVWAALESFVARLHGGYDVVQIEACRFAVQLLLMLLFWSLRRGTPPWRTQRPVSQVARAVLMLSIPLGYGLAVSHGATPTLALTGLWLAPLMALAVAHLWLRDRAPSGVWFATALGWVATVAVLAPAQPKSLLAAAVPVLMGLSLALYLAVTRSLSHESVQANLFYVAFGSVVLLLPLLPGVWVQPPLHDALLLVGTGVFGFFALWLLEQALRRWFLSNVAPMLYVHVACLGLVHCIVHRSVPSLRVLVGLAILSAVVLYVWRRALAQDRGARAPTPLFASSQAAALAAAVSAHNGRP